MTEAYGSVGTSPSPTDDNGAVAPSSVALGCDYAGYEFGASYPDSMCIEGYLWDADSDDGDGMLSNGGEIACPRCNTAEYLKDALERAKDGGCGVAMWTPHCAATELDAQVAHALRENPSVAARILAAVEPFEITDWPDRQAVYERRARWDDTVERLWAPPTVPSVGEGKPQALPTEPNTSPTQQQQPGASIKLASGGKDAL